jgi:hypothetical protein
MRYLAAALALAFAVGSLSVAQACPDNMMKTASTQVASTDGQSAPQGTKLRIPARPEGLRPPVRKQGLCRSAAAFN